MIMNSPVVKNEITVEGVLIHGSYTKDSVYQTTNFRGRDGDVYLATYPRSGTTWTQNIVFGIKNGPVYLEKVVGRQINEKFIYMEICLPHPGHEVAKQSEDIPRFMKTHLPAKLAPREIFTHGRKTIAVVRNPKDTALSVYMFYQNNKALRDFTPGKTKEEFWESFLEGKVFYGSWWEWTKTWIEKIRNSENMLLMHYEDLHDHFEEQVSRLTSFLDLTPLSENQLESLRKNTHVSVMKERYSDASRIKDFVDKGEKEAWGSQMSPEIAARFDELTEQFFKDDPIKSKFMWNVS